MLVVDVKRISPEPLAVLHRALQRRGWLPTSDSTFRIALKTKAADTDIVNYVERDVREAEYVAGLQDLQSVCLLNSHDRDANNRDNDPLPQAESDFNLT